MTKNLQGLTLDPEGKCLTKGKNKKDRVVKEEVVKCMETVKEELGNYTYNKYPWKTTVMTPDSSHVKIEEESYDNRKYDDNEELKAFYKKKFGVRRRYSEKERAFMKEAQFFHKHMDFRRHMMVFKRCGDDEGKECGDCRKHHKENPLPMGFWRRLGLPKRKQGALFFCPEMEENSEHTKSLLHQVFIKIGCVLLSATGALIVIDIQIRKATFL